MRSARRSRCATASGSDRQVRPQRRLDACRRTCWSGVPSPTSKRLPKPAANMALPDMGSDSLPAAVSGGHACRGSQCSHSVSQIDCIGISPLRPELLSTATISCFTAASVSDQSCSSILPQGTRRSRSSFASRLGRLKAGCQNPVLSSFLFIIISSCERRRSQRPNTPGAVTDFCCR